MNQTDGLDARQLGHLRHFDNLSRLPPNDWSMMLGRSVGQEDFGALRFQLAYMALATGLAYLHRMPAAPGFFKPIFERLFDKLLLPEVWMYWHDVSRGGSIFNAHLIEGYQEEWDPVRRDNIMYSAYVQCLALLYNYLFNDERYASPGAITFKHWSYFWGGDPKVFAYDQNSLNEHLYWLMVESGYIGVACEPNCVFQICNQPAILGFRLHDLLNSGSRAAEVTRAYEAAWQEFGRLGSNGHYNVMISQDSRLVRENAAKAPWVDAWCGALMNMWNRDFVRAHYPSQRDELIVRGSDDTLFVRPSPRPNVKGEKLITDDCDFGWVAVWASEMGDRETLTGLLSHADRFMRPQWHDGGLYYPRNDQLEDERGNRTLVEPHTGNALVGYARLNVPDGLWHLYNEELPIDFHKTPALVQVADDVDVWAAAYERDELHFRLSRNARQHASSEVVIGRLNSDRRWTLLRDGHRIATGVGSRLENTEASRIATTSDGISLRCPPTGVHTFRMTFA